MKRSNRAKPLPPVFVTKEVAEAYENGTEAEFIALYQPTMRYICTRINCWRHCRLPRCRRSRTCTGSHALSTFHSNFPPCITSNELHHAWLSEHRAYVAEVEASCGETGDGEGA